MDLLAVSINAAVVVVVATVVGWFFKGRFEAIDRRFDRLEARLGGRIDSVDGRIDGLESRLDRRFENLQASMDAMRSDLTQVALAVGIGRRAQND